MLNIHPQTRVFVCSEAIDMRYSFDALSGLVTSYFGLNPLGGHIFVFFSRRRDRMKLLFWDVDGFVMFYKRLERGSFTWVQELDLDEGGEIQGSDFAMILTGINPRAGVRQKSKKHRVPPPSPPEKTKHSVPLPTPPLITV